MYTITLPGLCLKYDSKAVAYEVFEVLCTVYEHDARISLQKNGKEVQYAVVEKDKADYKVVKVA
jgi:hypothetical protein